MLHGDFKQYFFITKMIFHDYITRLEILVETFPGCDPEQGKAQCLSRQWSQDCPKVLITSNFLCQFYLRMCL